ncbi:hypothetical protein IKQ21_02845 [bacterium]|nr:hypothetical protein [bacterium]
MGMAASQARLLTITARMHDVELKAQAIENAKVQLATQRDDVYEDYIEKLDAKKIQVAVGNNGLTRTYVDATFQSVCTYDPSRTQQYALKMADTGKIVVPEDVYDVYTNGGFSNDKYAFAWAMLGLEENFSWNLDDGSYGGREGMALGVGTDERGEDSIEDWDGKEKSLLMTDVEEYVYDNIVTANDVYGLSKLKEDFENAQSISEKRDAYYAYREKLYSYYGGDIYNYMILDKSDPDNKTIGGNVEKEFVNKDWADTKSKFDYYVRLFEEIHNAGGCVSISSVSPDGNTGNEWFNMVVGSGQMLIDMWVDNKTGWKETSVATSSSNNYLQEVSDEADLKKAEAEYEHELSIINNKDKKFDQDLKKLETERSALKTEMDSVKKVKEDNIERTFGIFS